jgi:hypothetical protein
VQRGRTFGQREAEVNNSQIHFWIGFGRLRASAKPSPPIRRERLRGLTVR